MTIGIRFGLYASLMILFGWPFFALYGLPSEGSSAPPRRVIAPLALLAAVLSIAGIVAMSAAMGGVSMVEVDRATIAAMVFETPMGSAWQVRMAALVAVAALAIGGWLSPRLATVVVVIAAAVALASLAWTGHGAAGEGGRGWLQLGGDIVHLLAAGAWIGALFALTQILRRTAASQSAIDVVVLHRALEGFALAGTLIVAILVTTGLISSWMLVGPEHVAGLFGSPYGRLLAVKLAFFAAMLGLAATNRYRLTPALARQIASAASPAEAIAALRRSITLEALLAGGILAVVAWLGTLAPPMAM